MTPVITKLEWQRALTTLGAVAVFVVVVASLYWARSIFIPLALAVFLSFVLSPVVEWLERRGLRRLPAVLATVGLTVVFVAVVSGLVAWQISNLAATLPSKLPQIKDKLIAAKTWVGGDGESRFGKMVEEIGAVFEQPKPPDQNVPTVVVAPPGTSWMSRTKEYLNPLLELIGQVAFAFILAVFMLLKQEDLRNRLIRLTGDTQVTTTTKATDDASKRISRYLFFQLLLNTAFGVIITVALLIIDVQYAVLWGFLASLMGYVPYIGTFLGLIPPAAFSFAMSDGWWQPITVIAVYGVLEIFSNNVIEPWLYGTSLGLSEVAQLVAAAFWTFLWGPIGLILSGPLTVCLLVLGKYVPRFQVLEVLLGDEPALGPDVRVYQRLTARDQDEATEVAREELKKSSAEEVFDKVLIPALTYVKRDADQGEVSAEERHAILESMREITDDVIERRLIPEGGSGDDEPGTHKARVLCVPGRDEADEVALEMLKGLLDPAKWEVEVSPVERLTSEVVAVAGESRPGAIVIGSLPPGGLAHTRYLCRRITQQFPEARVAVGRWGVTEQSEENRAQLTEVGAAHIATSLADMLQHLQAWRTALKNQQKPIDAAPTPQHDDVLAPQQPAANVAKGTKTKGKPRL